MSTYDEALPPVAQEPPGWDDSESIDAIPLRHWGRWVSAAIILFVLFALLWSLRHNPRVDISYVIQTLTAPFVLRGVVVTHLHADHVGGLAAGGKQNRFGKVRFVGQHAASQQQNQERG